MKNPPWLQAAVIVALALPPAALSALLHPKRPAWTREALAEGEIRLVDAQKLPNLIWVDARVRGSFQEAHIPGAILLNEDEWNTLLKPFATQWQPSANVVVYCDSLECDSSHQVANRLREELGAGNIYVLKGGWKSWQSAQK